MNCKQTMRYSAVILSGSVIGISVAHVVCKKNTSFVQK